MSRRRICVVVGSRANYSSIKSAMCAIRRHRDLDLQVVVMASALLTRFGSVIDLVQRDGFDVAARASVIVEGETPVTMAKSTGLGLVELPTIFDLLKPDVVVSVGDRFETMATAIAAAYMNIPLAHTMGGEVSGTIDESIRHAVTKLAHIHFPASQDAGDRIIRMGEDPQHVYVVGCPRIDLLAQLVREDTEPLPAEWFDRAGVGGHVDLERPYLLVSQHPVTTEYGEGERQIHETLLAVQQVGLPAVFLWPNADAGSEDVSRGIRKFREQQPHDHIRFFKHIPVDLYVRVMKRSACMIGNSSAAIREGAFLGVAAVNVGTRQAGRQRGSNVLDVGHDAAEIAAAVRRQLAHGPYDSDPIYGDGRAGERIADVLAGCPLQIQKRIHY
jgi:UDP-hydrolysing UDP-N-acetyl-D-glucosamine 2-epimerase